MAKHFYMEMLFLDNVAPHSRRELLDMIRRHRMQEAGPVFARDLDFAAP
jgi:hypothetical protein